MCRTFEPPSPWANSVLGVPPQWFCSLSPWQRNPPPLACAYSDGMTPTATRSAPCDAWGMAEISVGGFNGGRSQNCLSEYLLYRGIRRHHWARLWVAAMDWSTGWLATVHPPFLGASDAGNTNPKIQAPWWKEIMCACADPQRAWHGWPRFVDRRGKTLSWSQRSAGGLWHRCCSDSWPADTIAGWEQPQRSCLMPRMKKMLEDHWIRDEGLW
jgi:hypothetical protein